MRIIPSQCLSFLQTAEGCVLHSYNDTAGLPTIGTGHLIKPPESFPGPITQAEADDLLRKDLAEAAAAVDRLVTAPINDNQYSALVSLTFNIGKGGLLSSSLLAYINSGGTDPEIIAADFGKWNKDRDKATGQLVPVRGLTLRRAAEAALYNQPEVATDATAFA